MEFIKWFVLVQAWQRICDASRIEFQKIYDRLGITIQERGESFYNSMLGPLVEELMAKGIAVESNGAKVRSKRCTASSAGCLLTRCVRRSTCGA